MKIGSNNSFFTKENLKSEAKTAGVSAGLSTALTLAINKGKNPKQAAMVGLFAAGVSVAIGAVQKASALHQANKTANEAPNPEQNEIGVCRYHNG